CPVRGAVTKLLPPRAANRHHWLGSYSSAIRRLQSEPAARHRSRRPIVPPNQNANNWVNIAAFVQPPTDANGVDTHFGDARNGIVRAPNVWEADIALQKSTKVTEKVAVEFRAEAFNIFNHRQLGDPSNLDILST